LCSGRCTYSGSGYLPDALVMRCLANVGMMMRLMKYQLMPGYCALPYSLCGKSCSDLHLEQHLHSYISCKPNGRVAQRNHPARLTQVGSRTGAVTRKEYPWLYPRFPSSCPFMVFRSPVSSSRHIQRSMRFSRTTLS
jgi:hypothetical protein